MKTPLLALNKISKSFDSKEGNSFLFSDIDVCFFSGKSYALVGESGVGKSTLLHITSGLEKPSSGLVKFSNRDFWSLSKKKQSELRLNETAVIFQQFNLIPCISAFENIEFQARVNSKYDEILVKKLIKELRLENILDELPENLSGGEQQRVSIARALAAKPTILFADEPTGSLDEYNATIVIKMLTSLCKQYNTTLLLITHSFKIASYLDFKLELKAGSLNKK
jgi:putative ABC transport system ATP-binding protein